MGLLNTIKGTVIKETGDAVSGVIDKFVTTDKERMDLKKNIMDVMLGYGDKLLESAKQAVLTEMKGNWLQRTWRPIVMLAFAFIVVYEYFLAKVFNLPAANLPEHFYNLLELGLGGYVIGRSAEKIASKVTDNFDKIPTRKNGKN